MKHPTHASVLRLLYTMARNDRAADLFLLADELGLSCVATDRVLSELEKAGLVDAERVRLTLQGLAVAVALRPACARRGRVAPRSSIRAA